MQAPSNNTFHTKPTWQDTGSGFIREKNGKSYPYMPNDAALIGEGKRRKVYVLKPLETDELSFKPKAIKMETSALSQTQNEYNILCKLNANGPQVGIMKAPKALFKQGNQCVLIMPRYEKNMEFYVLKPPASSVMREALRQIVSGLITLQRNNIYHGDLEFSNVLCGSWQGRMRFDISDFELSLDLDALNFPTIEAFLHWELVNRPDFLSLLSCFELSNEDFKEQALKLGLTENQYLRKLLFKREGRIFDSLVERIKLIYWQDMTFTVFLDALRQKLKGGDFSIESIQEMLEVS